MCYLYMVAQFISLLFLLVHQPLLLDLLAAGMVNGCIPPSQAPLHFFMRGGRGGYFARGWRRHARGLTTLGSTPLREGYDQHNVRGESINNKIFEHLV